MLELSDRVVAHSAHEADLVIDEDKRGVVRCERVVGVRWVGHGVLLRKRCGCGGRRDGEDTRRRCTSKWRDLSDPCRVVGRQCPFRDVSCRGAVTAGRPLYPRKLPGHSLTGVSAKGRFRTYLPQQSLGDAT